MRVCYTYTWTTLERRKIEKFVADHPGELDVIKRVLFDDETLGTYEKELEQWEVSELVYSSEFDAMNRMLRDGGI